MGRYECSEAGASKFWEIRVEGTTLTTRYGRIGAKGTSSEKSFGSEDEAQEAAAKLIREKTGKGYALVGEATAEPDAGAGAKKAAGGAAKKPRGVATTLPPFDGVEPKVLQAVASKVQKKADADSYKVSQMLSEGSGVAYGRIGALAWHLVQHGALAAERHYGVLSYLSESASREADPVVVAELCTRLPEAFQPLMKRGYTVMTLLDAYPLDLDRLLVRTYHRDPEAFRSRFDRMKPNIQRAIRFIQGRCGEPVAPEEAADVLDQLARGQASGYGLLTNNDVPVVHEGNLVEHRLQSFENLDHLAERFGTREAWIQALLKYARTGSWTQLRSMWLALQHAPIEELGTLIAGRDANTSSDELQRLPDLLLKDRADTAEALVDAALAIPDDLRQPERGREVRELMLLCAFRKYQAEGREVPVTLDEKLEFKSFPSYSYKPINDLGVTALHGLPRERVVAMAERLLASEFREYLTAAPLAAHFDAGLFERLLAISVQRDNIPHGILARCGAQALPSLVQRLEEAAQNKKRGWHRLVLSCMAEMAEQGQPVAPEYEALVTFDREGGEDLGYTDSAREAMLGRIVRALPLERRVPLVMDRVRSEKYPVRPMAHLDKDAPSEAWNEAALRLIELRNSVKSGDLRTIYEAVGDVLVDALEPNMPQSGGDANLLSTLRNGLPHQQFQRLEKALAGAKETEHQALLRLTKEAQGASRLRTYVLQRVWSHNEDRGYTARPGSLTVSGGKAPGLDEASVPRDGKGEPHKHLFTLDLDDLPELRTNWPGARAVAYFCPEPERGERYDEAIWVPIPMDAEVKAVDGDPIAVVALDVPTDLFRRSKEPSVAMLRKMIFNAAGHVLGEPLWIQEEEGGDGAWVMQVNESLSEANTGDAGSLYVYTRGTTFQCH
ncbi:WGR domain-containing protein [Chondromyces crocatus]|uniref:WGR domain-containing protein n=1 Tax=Chondromyces crocatus TaxID=52 RepID=A0A0K1EAB1_CHOCO|nr:WGR domain-containing protein [Chondromyces crocatus]AKT37602.1 uncharacterized protein CMC5_017430 [Chondromyces crocatus]